MNYYNVLVSLPYRDYKKSQFGLKHSIIPSVGDTIYIPNLEYAELLIASKCISTIRDDEPIKEVINDSADKIEYEPKVEKEEAQINVTRQAKALAIEYNIDLSGVVGTGTDNKITKSDVQSLVDDLLGEQNNG